MDATVRAMPELELALLRRGLDHRGAHDERCRRCRRTPLIGERVYPVDTESILCELCRSEIDNAPAASRKVHGPEFGHTMRVFDNRAAA